MNLSLRSLTALLVASVTVLSAQAQDIKGDAAAGLKKNAMCIGCHGIEGYQASFPQIHKVPMIAGQSAGYIVASLTAYAKGERKHPTMRGIAGSLSDQDMADIAAFLQADVAKTGNPVKGTPPAVTATCVACHGNDGVGITPDYPTLAGQQADYIEHSLRAYKTGARKNPIMAGFVTALTDADIKSIAAYFSGQKGLCATDEIRKRGKCQ